MFHTNLQASLVSHCSVIIVMALHLVFLAAADVRQVYGIAESTVPMPSQFSPRPIRRRYAARDIGVAARERPDKAADIVMTLHRQRGQLQSGDPAFGARFQRGNIGGG